MGAVITQLQSIVGWSGEVRNPVVMFNQSLHIGSISVWLIVAEKPIDAAKWSVMNWTNMWDPVLDILFVLYGNVPEPNFDICGDWRSGPS